MGFARGYRLIEGSLVALFFLEAARAAFGPLLRMTGETMVSGGAGSLAVAPHLALLVAIALPGLLPSSRRALPRLLSLTAIGVALARLAMAVEVPGIRLYAALAAIGLGGAYLAGLLRANWQRWLIVWVVALSIDQLLRASDTYDLTLRPWLSIPAGEQTVVVPWLAIQAVLTAVLLIASRAARHAAAQEPYRPASLSPLGGVALGGFLAVEVLALAMPSVAARWSGLPFSSLVPWFVLATALPLAPGARRVMDEALTLFAERVQGWMWLIVLLMLIVVGNRLEGPGAAAALVAAQFMAMLLLGWIPSPEPAEAAEPRRWAGGMSVALLVFAAVVYGYGLTFYYYAPGLVFARDQGLVALLAAAVLLALPRAVGRGWQTLEVTPALPRGMAITFIAPAFVAGLLVVGLKPGPQTRAPSGALRIATYNMNGGYDARGDFQLEHAARTIEAADADIVVLQEVDAGHPAAFGVDEVAYLSQRLGMYEVFYPTVEQLRGLAVLSHWPLAAADGVLLPGAGEQLGAQRVSVQVGGSALLLVNTRLLPVEDAQRLEQMAVLLGLLEQGRPGVLAGDLGAAEGDVLYQQVRLFGLTDPQTVLGIEGGETVPAAAPAERHDYILLRDLQAVDSRQVQSAASDHRLVVVEVVTPPGPQP